MIRQEAIATLPRGQLVPWYLLTSFLYYCLDESAMTDDAYDLLCVRLDREWQHVTHPHKYIVQRPMLCQTTGYYLRRQQYPNVVQVAAAQFVEFARNYVAPAADDGLGDGLDDGLDDDLGDDLDDGL